MQKDDKYWIIGLILWLVVIIGSLSFLWYDNRKTKYCGVVLDMYSTSAGYKVREKPRIVFYSDSLKRNINIRVSYSTYSNTRVGEHVCFNLGKTNFD